MSVNPLSMSEEEVNAAIMSDDFGESDTLEENQETTQEEESFDEEQEPEQEKATVSDSEEEDLEESDSDYSDQEEEQEDAELENEEDSVSEEIDYEEVYKKVFSPFKANGKTIAISSPEEAIRLMQMGANYSKKMSSMKPSLKVLKTLEKNDLLDPEKLNHLIDISKKKPEAIAKLLKDSDIDPFNLDLSEENEYVPETYTTSDSEIELEEVLSNIRDTASYSETIDIISNKWDAASKQVFIQNPSLIETINEHVDNGTYAQIAKVVEKERMLGNLRGLTDLDAYKQVGMMLHEQANGKNVNAAKRTIKPATKKSVDPSLRSRKKEASLSTGKSTKNEANPFNPLSLSKEELDNLDWSKYV